MTTSRLFAALALVGAGACAETPTYVYSPEMPNAATAGLPATKIEIPQEAPQGAIELASYGVTTLSPDNANHARVAALHVRMIVTNDGDTTPWTIDTGQQLAEIAGEGQSRAMYVNADVRTLPIVTIGLHERHVVDLYYPLPDTIRDDAHLPRFDMLWQVATPTRLVASRSSFDRVDETPTVAAYDMAPGYWPYWAGYGPYWWYDPLWPTVGFYHVRPFHGLGHPRFVGVGRFGGHFRVGGARVAGGGGHHR